jgi:hypothetical protein
MCAAVRACVHEGMLRRGDTTARSVFILVLFRSNHSNPAQPRKHADVDSLRSIVLSHVPPTPRPSAHACTARRVYFHVLVGNNHSDCTASHLQWCGIFYSVGQIKSERTRGMPLYHMHVRFKPADLTWESMASASYNPGNLCPKTSTVPLLSD